MSVSVTGSPLQFFSRFDSSLSSSQTSSFNSSNSINGPSLLILMFPSFCDNQKIRKNKIHKHPPFKIPPFHDSPPIMRRKMKTSAGGEIVPVQGGHILRSTGRKDRHSKVCTAKGPRDRRVRLSAHTAIRFYDVQDRLGYDRPSKAVDWLIKKAKIAIDKLEELPPYFPISSGFTDPNPKTGETESSEFGSQLQLQSTAGNFAPPLESLFPMSSATTSTNFQGYPVNLILRPSDPARDLALSLHNFHDSRLLLSEGDGSNSPANNQRLIADSIPVGYDGDDAGLWLQQPLLGQNSAPAFSQRVSLQAGLGHSLPIRGWSNQNRQASMFGGRLDGSSEFCTPSPFRGEGGEDGVVSGTHSSSPNYRR